MAKQPDRTALIEVARELGLRDNLPPAELVAASEGLPENPRRFLEAFVERLSIASGFEAIGLHPSNHHHWMHGLAGYPEAFAFAEKLVNDKLEGLLTKRSVEGFREERYDKEGNLKEYRTRHDSALMKMLLQARMPDKYGKEGGGGTINIVVQQVNE